MSSAIESDSQSGSTELSVVGGQTVVADAANRDGINTGRITIAITVIICQATIACCPDIDITFTFTTLETQQK